MHCDQNCSSWDYRDFTGVVSQRDQTCVCRVDQHGFLYAYFFCAVEKLRYLSESLQQLQSYTNIKDAYVKILFKMIGITYVADFAAGICKDAGYGAISSQIEFFGKISVLATGTPVLLALFETIRSCLA